MLCRQCGLDNEDDTTAICERCGFDMFAPPDTQDEKVRTYARSYILIDSEDKQKKQSLSIKNVMITVGIVVGLLALFFGVSMMRGTFRSFRTSTSGSPTSAPVRRERAVEVDVTMPPTFADETPAPTKAYGKISERTMAPTPTASLSPTPSPPKLLPPSYEVLVPIKSDMNYHVNTCALLEGVSTVVLKRIDAERLGYSPCEQCAIPESATFEY